MRVSIVPVLAAAALSLAGCGGKMRCYEAAATCTVTCDALPGQVFTGRVVLRNSWSSGDPEALPGYTLEQDCRGGHPGPAEAAPCYAATPGENRNQAVACTCGSPVVTNDDAECPSSNWTWK